MFAARHIGALAILLSFSAGQAYAEEQWLLGGPCDAANRVKVANASKPVSAGWKEFNAARTSGDAALACSSFAKLLKTVTNSYPVFSSVPTSCLFGVALEKFGPGETLKDAPKNCDVQTGIAMRVPAARTDNATFAAPSAPATTSMPKSASCSDITGTNSGGPAATNCRSGDAALTAAQKQRWQNPAAARAKYQEAADAYRRAGDIAMANAILDEAKSLIVASAPNPPPQASGANQAPPFVPSAAPSAARPSAPQGSQQAGPPAAPQGNQQAALPAAPQAATSTSPQDALPSAQAGTGACVGPNLAPYCAGQDYSAYCAYAQQNPIEQTTALWGYVCVPDPASAQPAGPAATTADMSEAARARLAAGYSSSRHYVSPISPRDLNAQALKACPDMALEQRRVCVENAKLRILLAGDPNVGAECADILNRDEQLACADVIYLYGPRAPWRPGQKKVLWSRLDAAAAAQLPAWMVNLTDRPSSEGKWDDVPLDHRCPPGQAVQPIPGREGGFGRWDCAPIPTLIVLQDRPDGDTQAGASADAANVVKRFEEKAKEVASLVATAIAPKAGAQLAAKDRALCTAAAYASVLSMMKGGSPPVPPMCGAVVFEARREAANFLKNSFYTGDRSLDALLAVLSIRYETSGFLGPPPQGLAGLAPSADDSKFADCVAAGGTWESCGGGAAPKAGTAK